MHKTRTCQITLYKYIDALIAKLYSKSLNNAIRVLSTVAKTIDLLYKTITAINMIQTNWHQFLYKGPEDA